MKKKSLFLGGALMFAMTFTQQSLHLATMTTRSMKKWKTR